MTLNNPDNHRKVSRSNTPPLCSREKQTMGKLIPYRSSRDPSPIEQLQNFTSIYLPALLLSHNNTPIFVDKRIHIGTGLIYVLTWPLYPANEPSSRIYASLVPGIVTFYFTLLGMGILKDQKVVLSMSRSGNPRELLYGPASYGVILMALTLVYWVHSPIGIASIAILCVGDGLAGLIGEEMGVAKLPHNRNKSIVGTLSFLIGAIIGPLVLLSYLQSLGYLMTFSKLLYLPTLIITSFVTMLVESLPIDDWDNITVFISAVACHLLFGY
eukprot:gene798-992_t